jgi:hypothetical protein
MADEPQLSRQEIVFWICLFGLDLGVPLMLPDSIRWYVGIAATAASLAGLTWSWDRRLNFTLPSSLAILVGVVAISHGLGLIRTMGIWIVPAYLVLGSAICLLARVLREQTFELYLARAGHNIHSYLDAHGDNVTALDPVSWRQYILGYWYTCGKYAARLIRESLVPSRKDYISGIKSPDTFAHLRAAAEIVEGIGYLSEARKFRLRRFVKAGIQGAVIGSVFGIGCVLLHL